MKHSDSEPPGREPSLRLARRQQRVVSLPPANLAPTYSPGSVVYRSVDDMVHETRPDAPVHCLRPATIAATAKWFLKSFPGDVMYSVKSNPDPRVLKYLARAGVKHFDVASLAEVKLVAEYLPEAAMYFMHPVKSREAIAGAYFDHGVRDFSLDSMEELQKILDVTKGAPDLHLYVRLAMPNDKAVMSLSGKFGIAPELSEPLVKAARNAAAKFGICFHVGSQCMKPDAYLAAVQTTVALVEKTGVTLDVLDVGGGFPSIYPGLTPPPLSHYTKAVKKALKLHPQLANCQIVCEPGRALVAEGGSVVVRVELRKGNALYLNDGTYGCLFDAGTPGFVFPVKAIRPGGMLSKDVSEFSLFGPTCDSLDAMKGPFHLPADIAEGDWIEIGQMGAYGATMRTRFNGFYSDTTVEVADKPLLSMFGIN